jgi:acetate kinase
MAGDMKILVLNGGSSTLKCWFQDVPEGRRWTARTEWKSGEQQPERLFGPLLQSLWQGEKKAIDSPAEIDMVGHRIVHGGPKYRDSVLITPDVRAGIAEQAQFAPVHNKLQLAAIETVDRVIGTKVPQVAVFDTGFHATLQPAAYVYPGPYAWLEQGIRRYGFHGISVEYSTRLRIHRTSSSAISAMVRP